MLAPGVPEVIELDIGEGIEARTEQLSTLRELGPPDLVHLIRHPTKTPQKEQGVYHHVTGVDASSSASLAAYINTLTYTPDKSFKITSGTFCCYNAFSRVDMRVHVTIPGTVESYCIDEGGNKRHTTEALWLETFLCGFLRAYSYADDGSGDSIRKVVGVRRFNPITSTEAEHRFFDAAERLFFNGWQLGSDPEIQVPNLVSNHLTTGILNYVRTTGRYASGINLFEKLRSKNIEVSSLLARVLIDADEEVRAVALLHEAINHLPMDYALLDAQAKFCKSKGRGDMALECAKRGVIAAPSEFVTWATLAEVYVSLEMWELALLTLNSCPMFTYQDRDLPRMPEPASIRLPVLPETSLDEIESSEESRDQEVVHPTLRKLHASSYRGTFLKAYNVLTKITAKIGWDQLLKFRSNVFVMEEEYRSEKATSKNASTVALKSDSSEDVNGDDEAASESGFKEESIEKPEHTVASEVVKSGNEDPDPAHSSYSQFQNKRLCERWLDNLFMVLYEDLRIYTIWRTEMAQYKQQQMPYRKSAEEWEILGELAERLHHKEEAEEAYRHCLATRFSPKALSSLLTFQETKNDSKGAIESILRLICWQYRWYSEFSPKLLYSVRRLIEEEGALKVQSIIQATNLPQPVRALTNHYAELCHIFKSSGTEG